MPKLVNCLFSARSDWVDNHEPKDFLPLWDMTRQGMFAMIGARAAGEKGYASCVCECLSARVRGCVHLQGRTGAMGVWVKMSGIPAARAMKCVVLCVPRGRA